MAARGLGPADVGRRSPPHAWEAYLLIGVFPGPDGPLWSKVHLFSGGTRPARHCISAVEALDGQGERLVLVGSARDVLRVRTPLEPGDLARAPDRWDISAPGVAWRGDLPRVDLEVGEPAVRASFRAADLMRWVHVPRVLGYWGSFGHLEWSGPGGVAAGLGVLEHAWGADTRLDVARLAPPRWQWDVLAFDEGGWCAGLSVGVAGRMVGVRAGGRAPGEPMATGRFVRVRVTDWTDRDGRAVPARWSGAMRLGAGALRYEARASTPVAAVVPDGGFVGFRWTGEWTSGDGAARPASGAGFTEYRAARAR